MKHGETRKRAEGISMLNGGRETPHTNYLFHVHFFFCLGCRSHREGERGRSALGSGMRERDTHTEAKVDSRQKWRRCRNRLDTYADRLRVANEQRANKWGITGRRFGNLFYQWQISKLIATPLRSAFCCLFPVWCQSPRFGTVLVSQQESQSRSGC